MKKNLIFAIALFAAPAVVFAGDEDKGQGPANTRPLNWDEFKHSCENPEAFQAQRPPENIRITCGDRFYNWMPTQEGSVQLPSSRTVRTSVMSDKFEVKAQDAAVEVAPQRASCPRFVEMEETVVIERAVTCAEILAYQGDLKSFCTSVVDDARSENPDLVSKKETGRTVNTCKK